MKILFLTPWYPDERNPNHGIFIRNLAIALAEHHDVMVISAKIDYSSFGIYSFKTSSSTNGRLQEYRLVIKRSLPLYNQLNYFLIAVGQAVKLGRVFQPDLIHGNIGYPGAAWSWLVSNRINKPFLVTEHTRLINNFRSFFHRWMTLRALDKSLVIHTVSNRMAHEIKAITGKKCVVIPNIILTKPFAGIISLRNATPSIGFLGGLDSAVKGLDLLLNALSRVRKPFVLHIAGSGRLLEEYKNQADRLGIAGRCTFHGFVPHWEVPDLMNKLNFLVSASRYESFGMTILEAMASGIPVVGTTCGGPEDFVTRETGILVPPENENALRDAIEWMMDNYPTYKPATLRQYVKENFSAARVVQQMNKVYEGMVSGLPDW